MQEYPKLEWRCVNCNAVLSAFMQSTLEILIRAHNHVHAIEAEKIAKHEPWNSPAAVIANNYIGEPVKMTKEPPTTDEMFEALLTEKDKESLRSWKIGY